MSGVFHNQQDWVWVYVVIFFRYYMNESGKTVQKWAGKTLVVRLFKQAGITRLPILHSTREE